MKNRGKTILLSVIFIILLVGAIYFYPPNKFIMTSSLDNNVTTTDINIQQLSEEQLVEVSKNEQINIQDYLMFGIFIVLLLILILYVIAVYLMPYLNKKRIERKNPIDAFNLLTDEFEKNKKNRNKAEEISSRINHLYSYLSKNEKIRVKGQMRDIKRYLNKLN